MTVSQHHHTSPKARAQLTAEDLSLRKSIRRQMRHQRRRLGKRNQRIAAEQLAKTMCKRIEFIRAQRITAYCADDGEIDPRVIIRRAWTMNMQVGLPVIDARDQMRFVSHKPSDRLSLGRWGLKQPAGAAKVLSPLSLNIILLPLVAFDRQGNRLGRGGGYFDRYLSQLKHKPLLIGLAHHNQCVDHIPAAHWDVPLDAIATEKGFICCDN